MAFLSLLSIIPLKHLAVTLCASTFHIKRFRSLPLHCINTGRFIIFSVITNIYIKKTKGSTLMELFTATLKLKKVFFLTTRDFRCVQHGWHGTHLYDIQGLATHTRQHGCIDVLLCCNDPCLKARIVAAVHMSNISSC
jgi:hypothetical protein